VALVRTGIRIRALLLDSQADAARCNRCDFVGRCGSSHRQARISFGGEGHCLVYPAAIKSCMLLLVVLALSSLHKEMLLLLLDDVSIFLYGLPVVVIVVVVVAMQPLWIVRY